MAQVSKRKNQIISESRQERVIRMRAVIRELGRLYPNAECTLRFRNPFELLVATILSAQCTDERVNRVTPALFERFPTPQKMAQAPVAEIEDLVQSTGFFRSKARALIEASQGIVRDFGGQVPRRLDDLIKLRGVGRKTANVVLGNAFGDPALAPGVVVDTHVGRLMRRLGFSAETEPVNLEKELTKIVPPEYRVQMSHWLIEHGRAVCTARRPQCEICGLARLCPKII